MKKKKGIKEIKAPKKVHIRLTQGSSHEAEIDEKEQGQESDLTDLDEDVLCYGKHCYSTTFWAMAVSVWVGCGLWGYAWKGPNGWAKRGIPV